MNEGARLAADGQLALHEGDVARARPMLEQSRKLAIAQYGENHPIVAMQSLFLSQALHMSGDHAGARDLLGKAREIYDAGIFEPDFCDSFERTLIQVCTMQGHFLVVEDIEKIRIERLRAMGQARDHDRAIEQDVLAHLYLRQERLQEALALLEDSVAIFESGVGESHRDAGVCYAYLHRAHRRLGNFEQAVRYGEKCLRNSVVNLGADHIETVSAADNLAVAMCRLAELNQDAALGNEGLRRATAAFDKFIELEGPQGRSALLCAENIRKLSSRLANVPGIVLPETPSAGAGIIIPNHCFISHSYRDSEIVKKLLAALPQHVKPIVFEPIDVSPSDYVSTKLVNAVSSCDAVIVVDAAASNSSFWTAFERNLAARLQKPMLKFNADTLAIERFSFAQMFMMVSFCCHPKDESAVEPLIRWLSDEQSFAMVNDRRKHGDKALPMFGRLDAKARDAELETFRRLGRGVYIVFITDDAMKDGALRKHIESQATSHPESTLFCWLSRRPRKGWFDGKSALSSLSGDQCFEFGASVGLDASHANKFDDLMVRLFWLFHKQGLGIPVERLASERRG